MTDCNAKKIAEIVGRVVCSFEHGKGDEIKILSQWKSKMLAAQGDRLWGSIVHEFSAPETFDSLVQFFRADIADDVALHRARVSRRRRAQAYKKLLADISEFDLFDLDEEGGDLLNPAHLAITRENEADEIARKRQIVDVSRVLAEEADGEEQLCPNDQALVSAFSNYFDDLASLSRVNPEETRQLIKRIVNDIGFAEKVLAGTEAPKPLRYLADCVIQCSSFDCKFETNGATHVGGTYL